MDTMYDLPDSNVITNDGTGQAVAPSTLQSVNSLLATIGGLGLSIYSDVTGKPIITTPGPAGSAVPVSSITNTTTILIVAAVIIVAFVVLKDE
jgi:hypothetical protein